MRMPNSLTPNLMPVGIMMSARSYCRGGPPWPPGVERDLQVTCRTDCRGLRSRLDLVPRDRVPRRAATEGRPYRTFRSVSFLYEIMNDETKIRGAGGTPSALTDSAIRITSHKKAQIVFCDSCAFL